MLWACGQPLVFKSAVKNLNTGRLQIRQIMERGLFFPLGKSGIAEPTLLLKGQVAEGGRGVPCPSSRFFLCLSPPPYLSSALESCRLSNMWPLYFRVHSHLPLLCYYEFGS